MQTIISAKQCDTDADMLPLWYWWYTNIYKVDHFVIMAAAVKGSTSIKQIKEFWRDKPNVTFIEKVYENWFAPTVHRDLIEIVKTKLPKTGFVTFIADLDELFEPLDLKETGNNKIVVVPQVRLWVHETPTVDNSKNLNLYKMSKKQKLINIGSVGRLVYINTVPTPASIKARNTMMRTSSYYFHFHFRGLKLFKNKFKKMKFASRGPGASWHWKQYSRLVSEHSDLIDNLYEDLIKYSEENFQAEERFREYFCK